MIHLYHGIVIIINNIHIPLYTKMQEPLRNSARVVPQDNEVRLYGVTITPCWFVVGVVVLVTTAPIIVFILQK